MGLLQGYIETLEGALAIHDACTFNFGGLPDCLKQVSPQFRMFLDSDFGSPIEKVTKEMWADSILEGCRNKFPQNKLGQKLAVGLGCWIGEKANGFMDRMKLLHQYHYRKITIQQYADIRSTQVQATMINIADKAKKCAWMGRLALRKGLELVGIPMPETLLGQIAEATGIRKVVKWVGDGVEKIVRSEKTKNLIRNGVVLVHSGITAISNACKVIKEEVVEPVLETIADVAKVTVKTLTSVAKKGWNFAKSVSSKIWSFISK